MKKLMIGQERKEIIRQKIVRREVTALLSNSVYGYMVIQSEDADH